MNTAIIAAAGSGKRFGGKKPKQFLPILGKPLLIHTIEKFEKCGRIQQIILVLNSAEAREFSNTLDKFNFSKLKKIVEGGKTRVESVKSGFEAIEKETAKIVAVHDGARPLVSVEEISETVETAEKHGAACLVGKVTDTIKKVSDGKIEATIDRENLRRALTPQCFRYEILREAFNKEDFSEDITDECSLVEKLGYEIAVVEGSAKNIKITHKDDLKFAEVFLKEI